MLSTCRTVIVDEIHAIAGNKRGAHLALSLERLQALVGRPLVRIGLSATQKPIEEVARFLIGVGRRSEDVLHDRRRRPYAAPRSGPGASARAARGGHVGRGVDAGL